MAADDDLNQEEQSSGVRPFWSGTITFGLVSVPVALFPANRPRSQGVSFRMVSEEGSPLERRYICPEEDKEIGWDEIVRGYEVDKGKFVVISDEELEVIEPRKTRDIDLQLFVDVHEIPPVYFDRAYFLAPAGGSNKAYRLLAEVMESRERAGIATFVMRAKEYLVAIIAEKGILRAETLRFEDEIRTPSSIGLPKMQKAKPAEVKKLVTAIKRHSGKVDFREFVNDYPERVEALASKKKKKGDDVIRVPKEERNEEEAEVVDLMEVLSRSLAGSATRRKSASRATSRKSSSKASKKRSPAKRKASTKKKASGKRKTTAKRS